MSPRTLSVCVSPQLCDDKLCSAVFVPRNPAWPYHCPSPEPGQEHRGLPAVAMGHPVGHEHEHRPGHQNQPLHRGPAGEARAPPTASARPSQPAPQFPCRIRAPVGAQESRFRSPTLQGVEMLLVPGSRAPVTLKQNGCLSTTAGGSSPRSWLVGDPKAESCAQMPPWQDGAQRERGRLQGSCCHVGIRLGGVLFFFLK